MNQTEQSRNKPRQDFDTNVVKELKGKGIDVLKDGQLIDFPAQFPLFIQVRRKNYFEEFTGLLPEKGAPVLNRQKGDLKGKAVGDEGESGVFTFAIRQKNQTPLAPGFQITEDLIVVNIDTNEAIGLRAGTHFEVSDGQRIAVAGLKTQQEKPRFGLNTLKRLLGSTLDSDSNMKYTQITLWVEKGLEIVK